VALPQTIRFDNLLSAAKAHLTPDVVRNASVMTGESETATRQAMHGGVASVFAGLTNMASTAGGASALGNLSREPTFGKLLNNVPSAFSGGSETSSLMDSGQNLLGKIFGDPRAGWLTPWPVPAVSVLRRRASSWPCLRRWPLEFWEDMQPPVGSTLQDWRTR
jgi:hypothetical protein